MIFWKFFTIGALFFVAALAQSAFLPHMSVMGALPNLVFILFFAFIFFEKLPSRVMGIAAAIGAGFLLDVFSPSYFGIQIASLLLVYGAIKTIIYFLRDRQEEYLLVYFIPVFTISFTGYQGLVYVILNFPHLQLAIPAIFYIQLAYNISLALIGFYLFKYATSDHYKNRQLNLFR